MDEDLPLSVRNAPANPAGYGANVLVRLRGIFASPGYRPPVLPKAAMELLVLTRKPNARLDEILHLLEQDPLMCGSILRIARSAAYTRGAPVESVREAIVRMGLTTIAQIFFEVATSMRVFKAPAYDPVMTALRKHSAATAHIASRLARQGAILPEHAFISGLLHDVGIAVSAIALAESYPPGKAPPFDMVWPAVREVHQEAGAFVTRLWGLPDFAVHAAGSHHAGPGDGTAIVALVAIAEAASALCDFGFADEAETDVGWALERLGITTSLEEIARTARADLARVTP